MMNRHTGAAIALLAHITQSIADILTTPLGSRVMRRNYGSLIPYLIDQPDNAATQIRVLSAAASAVMRWEPRVTLRRVALLHDPARQGYAELQIQGTYTSEVLPRPQPLNLSVPVRGAVL